jgi:hypothetical protein
MRELRTGTIISIVLVVALFVVTAMADVIRQGTLQASSDGVDVTVGTDGEFVAIGRIDPKGPSLYEYVDHSAFMKTGAIYQYRIRVSFSNGQAPYYSNPLTISHTVSGVRRTWGSIKAMFR